MATLSSVIMLGGVGVFVADLGTPFVEATGLVNSANYSGGEVVQTIDHGAYQTQIHRPVFDALIGERREGFIQVVWTPPEALPARIVQEIDIDANGRADFHVDLDTVARQATLTPYDAHVLELEGVYDLGESLAIRVVLENPRR